MPRITPFLMFDGQAEEAMNLYVSLFPNSRITSITRYQAGEAGKEASVMQAVFSLDGHEYMCMDSSVQHDFTFTPALSLFVICETEDEVRKLFEGLSQDGQILMPLGSYPFSRLFAWISDRFGVSWQLNLGS